MRIAAAALFLLAMLALAFATTGCGVGSYVNETRTAPDGTVTERKSLYVGSVLKSHAIGELDVQKNDAGTAIKLKDASTQSNAAELLEKAARLAR